jgi:hypothetical protein
LTIEVRAVIHFFDLLDMPDDDILALIKRRYGDGIVNLKTVQRWALKFCNGKQTLTMHPDEGHPDKAKITGSKNCD